MDLEKALYKGPCVGGPLDGQICESRFPSGFLLVDRRQHPATLQERRLIWLYDWDADNERFHVRDPREGSGLDTEKARAAAESSDWDVRAL